MKEAKNKGRAYWLCRDGTVGRKTLFYEIRQYKPQWQTAGKRWLGQNFLSLCPKEFEKLYPQHKLKPGTLKRVRISITDY